MDFDSKEAVFTIVDVNGVERDLSDYVTKVSGLPGERPVNDSTTLSSVGRKKKPTVENAKIRIEGMFDNTAVSGPDIVLRKLKKHTSAVKATLMPQGNVAGAVKYYTDVWVTNYETPVSVGNMVSFVCDMESHGEVFDELVSASSLVVFTLQIPSGPLCVNTVNVE